MPVSVRKLTGMHPLVLHGHPFPLFIGDGSGPLIVLDTLEGCEKLTNFHQHIMTFCQERI